ncbi:MAG: hypothetical protein QXY40_10585 [Candidatus Methanomethylicia archaeon]
MGSCFWRSIRWLIKAFEDSGLLGLIGFRMRVRAVLLYGWPELQRNNLRSGVCAVQLRGRKALVRSWNA